MDGRTGQIFSFGRFLVDAKERRLVYGDRVLQITPKALDTLLVLLKNAGRVVMKDELLDAVWPDTAVEEATLAQNVATIRKVLTEADSGSVQHFIETVPKFGYRFVAPVEIAGEKPLTRLIAREASNSGGPTPESAPWSRIRSPGYAIVLLFGISTSLLLGVKIFLDFKKPATVAVLPLVQSNSADTTYLCEGLVEDVIDQLSRFPDLSVSAFSSVYRFRDQALNLNRLADDLGVENVLTMRLISAEDAVKAHVELVDATDGSRIWGKQYTWTRDTLIEAPSQIALEASSVLGARLLPEQENGFEKPYTNNSQAYRFFLHGQFFWHQFTREALEKSISYFQAAVDHDPQYALAYAAIADSYNVLGLLFWPPRDAFPRAEAAALNAIRIDETLAEAYISLGAYKLFYEWNWSESQKALDRAAELKQRYADSLELFTRYGDSHHYYCYLLDSSGRLEESMAEIRKALRLDPLSQTLNAELGYSYLFSGMYQDALMQFRKTLELDPAFVFASYGLAQVLVQLGQHDEAIAELGKARLIAPQWATLTAQLALVYGASGDRSAALQTLEELSGQAQIQFIDPFNFALVHLGIGDQLEALHWLEKAYEQRSPQMIWLKVDPRFDGLRSHPNFASLLRRVWAS